MRLRIRREAEAQMLQAMTPTKSRTVGRLRTLDTAGGESLRTRIATFNRQANPGDGFGKGAWGRLTPGGPLQRKIPIPRRIGRPSLQEFVLAAHAEFADVLETRTGLRCGERLAALRLRAELTQAALAAAAKCSQSQIADWERGRSEPGMASLRVLARALGCSLSDLVAE